MRGEVIGINSQIATLSGGYNGISFAVPIDEAIRVSEQLKKSGKVTRGRIGVQIGEVSKEVAESLGLKVSDLTADQRKELGVDGGVVVESAEGVAGRAGLQDGDVLLQLNNIEIKDAKQFNAVVAKLDTKKASVVLVRRGDVTQYIS